LAIQRFTVMRWDYRWVVRKRLETLPFTVIV